MHHNQKEVAPSLGRKSERQRGEMRSRPMALPRFVCPACGSRDPLSSAASFLCRLPEADLLKSGTIFGRCCRASNGSGACICSQSKNSVSTLELARQLGVRPDTAALMRQLMSVMFEREASRKLDGASRWTMPCSAAESELDGGKRGRSGPNKTPFVVAVETSDDGRPLRLLLHVVKVHDGAEIGRWRRRIWSPARIVRTGSAASVP